MKTIALAVAASLLAVPAMASGMQWVSAPVFVGQTHKPGKGLALTWYPAIISTSTDANGYYEVWVQNKPYYQESYADHKAIKARATCDETGDNSCVNGQGRLEGSADLQSHLSAVLRVGAQAPSISASNQVAAGGAERDRTADLLNAIQALSQLSYGPAFWGGAL